MKLTPETSQAVAIDIQERLVPVMADSERLIQKSVLLIRGLRILGVPILVTQQYSKGLGRTIPEVRHLLGDFTPCEKTTFSCCEEASFCDSLDPSRPNLIVFGIEAHICVQQTVCDLLELGKKVWFVADCIKSRAHSDKEMAIKRMIQEGARPATSESILFELLSKGQGDLFRQISHLVK